MISATASSRACGDPASEVFDMLKVSTPGYPGLRPAPPGVWRGGGAPAFPTPD